MQYTNQVVATKRGAGKLYMDTAKAMQQFGNTLQQIKSVLNDTAFAVPVVKPSVAKDSLAGDTKKNNVKKKKTTKPATTTVGKTNNAVVNKKQPRAVMKKH